MKAGRWVIGALLAGGLAFGAAQLSRSSLLNLERVEVSGNHHLSAAQVVDASGLSVGDKLLRVSTRKVAARVENLPWIAKARVERIIPSRVRITVSERVPAAQVPGPDGMYVCDRSGVVIDKAQGGSGQETLVKIVDLPRAAPAPGGRIEGPEFASALAVLDSLAADLRSRAGAIHAASADALKLELADGSFIIYGSSDQLAEKNAAAETLIQRSLSESSPFASIDVRVPRSPSMLPR